MITKTAAVASTKLNHILEISSGCSSMEEFDKQTLRELHKSETDHFGPEVEGIRQDPDLVACVASLQLKVGRNGPASDGDFLKTISQTLQTTAGQSNPNSKQEFGLGPKTPANHNAHTESSGSKRGLARHRNSIGLLTDNLQNAARSFSQLHIKDTPCQNSSASKESYLLAQDYQMSAQNFTISPTLARISLRKGSISMNSAKKPATGVNTSLAGNSNMHVLIEPLEESSITQGHSNHQVPLISRIPSSMMKRSSTSRPLFVAKKKTKILQKQEPVLAHHKGDDCFSFGPVCIPVELESKAPAKSAGGLILGFKRMLAKIGSAADESQLFSSKRNLDESSVRLQSMRGSVHTIKKTPGRMTPADSLHAQNGRRKFSFNLTALRYQPEHPADGEPESCGKSANSNLSLEQLPAFEVSRMLLVVPGSFRSSCIKQRFPSSKRLIAQRPVESLHPEDGTGRRDTANGGGSPELDTNLDLGAMIRDCDVLQKHLIDPNRS